MENQMSSSSTNNSIRNSATTQSEKEVDVLYQRLGDQWFAFSIVEDEVFMSPVSEDIINDIKLESAVNTSLGFNEAA